MPGRITPLINGQVYHIFNRGVASQPTFFSKRDYDRALESFLYYQNDNPPIKYSRFLTLAVKQRDEILEELSRKRDYLAEITSYCLMPNHFHFLLKQTKEGGISKFISNFTNSYTRYVNTKMDRAGPLFTGKFKSVRIETQQQLIHTSRYIHLNPYTSFVIKSLDELEKYPYSSFPEFINKSNLNICMKDDIVGEYKNINDYKKFVFDQADYQRTLHQNKHLFLD